MGKVLKLSTPLATPVATPGHNISDLARVHGLSRTTVRRRLQKGWDPGRSKVEKYQGVSTPGHGRVHPPSIPRPSLAMAAPVRVATPPALSKAQITLLRQGIREWVELQHQIAKEAREAKARAKRQPRSDWLAQVTCSIIGVGFFALLARAALG